MVMADQESPSIDLKHDQGDQGVPLHEVLGEAEARFGPMPTCIRSILLPEPHPSVSTTISSSDASFKAGPELQPSLNINGGLGSSERDHGDGTRDKDDQEGGISLDDIALVSSSPTLKDSNSFTQDDDDPETRAKSDTIFLELDDDYDENARRSPDSGCSMSEASDKVSIASTVSASSDDGGMSRLGSQIQRLKQAMSELREQDVALARQLLTVYDYVEETKWFLENFEACDPRHSMTSPMTSTERRFSQNFQKRLSDFGIKGVPHSGFATPPSWTELNGGAATPKRHSRNISDGMLSIEHLRRIYHENNNNASIMNLEGVDKSELGYESIPDGPLLDGSTLKHRSPRSMTRRSISSNFLEISFNSMTSNVDHCRHQGPLSPITDSGKIVTMNDGDGDDGDLHLQSTPLPQTNHLDKTGLVTTAVDEKRTNVHEIVSFYVAEEEQASADPHLTPHHHRGSASSSSASSMMSLQSCSSTSSSSTDTCTRSNASHNTTKTMNIPPLSLTTGSLEPTADDCSIFIAEDADDPIIEYNRSLMSPFESHMNWLQEQDETLL